MKVYYDRAKCPPTFDVVTALLRFERERLRLGADALDIEILPGPVGGFRQDTNWPQGLDERRRLLDAIVVPMCQMLPSARSVTVRETREDVDPKAFGLNAYAMAFKDYVACYGQGIRPLRPALEWPRDERLVTITLRECEHWPGRNSRLEEWVKAARRIAADGFRVVFVRDTRFASLDMRDFAVAPEASRDLEERARLYRSAFCNLGINNGPMWFALALDAPVVMLRPATEGIGRCYGAEWFKRCGMTPGGPMRGAPGHQRIVWEDDTAKNILNAFNGFCDGSQEWSNASSRPPTSRASCSAESRLIM